MVGSRVEGLVGFPGKLKPFVLERQEASKLLFFVMTAHTNPISHLDKCVSDPTNLARVKTFLIEIALKYLDPGGIALIHNSVDTSSEWAKHAL